MEEFCNLINQTETPGDIVEFGTGSGGSADDLASNVSKERKIFTFDGFVGLPKTSKGIPQGTAWRVGAFCYDETQTRKVLEHHSNVFIEKTMTSDLKLPSDYGITKIVAVNLDLDLYEGTLDGLQFIDKCEWNTILLRFDDWGYYVGIQIAAEVDAHEKAAFYDWIEETKYQYEIDQPTLNKAEGRQSIIKVKR